MRHLSVIVVLSLFLASLLMGSSLSHACVGARPYGMGLAFVAVADDVNATYWNPAGLVQLDLREATYMRNMNARESINYQDYWAYAQPLDENSAVAVSYIRVDQIPDVWSQNWYWVSYARVISPETSLGLNVRSVNDDVKLSGVSIDTRLGLDFSVLHRVNEQLSIGLLVQNANEPDSEITTALGMYLPVEIDATHPRNWRPGIAYQVDPTLTVAMSVYDALDEADGLMRHLRVGVEKIVETGEDGRYQAWRIGYAGLWAESDAIAPKGLTLGLGLGSENFKVDAALLMGDFNDAWFLSATTSFP